MAQKKIVKKTSKKDDLDPSQDEFVTTSMSFLDWAFVRRRQIGALIAIAILASVGAIVYNHINEQKAAEATRQLSLGLSTFLAPVVEEAEAEDSQNDTVVTFNSIEDRANQSLKNFGGAEKDNKNNNIGALAQLGIAEAHYDKGEFEKAISAYEAFLSASNKQLQLLNANAIEGLAYALEAAGKTDQAKAKFEELKTTAKGRASLLGEYHLARLSLTQGKKEEAIKGLQSVVDKIAEQKDFDGLDYVLIQAGDLLKSLDPNAEVPEVFKGFDGIDPQLMQRLMQMQQAKGAGN